MEGNVTENEESIIEIYRRERDYQSMCFGNYKDVKSLNFGSFLQFIEAYLERSKKAYSGKWDRQLPEWLSDCEEMKEGSAPVEAYEQIIKVMALCGAALETYATLCPYEWRKDPENDGQKWKE